MNATIVNHLNGELLATVTTEHSLSSYGQPVLINGVGAFQASEVILGWNDTAASWLKHMLSQKSYPTRIDGDRELVRKFLIS
ncbi:MAG: hypothetical protein ACXVBB_01145 [Isosphaeraceae bacterium]